MVMNEPKNSRASAGMSAMVRAPARAEVLRAAADLDHLGVAGHGEEVVRDAGHRVLGAAARNGPVSRQLGEQGHAFGRAMWKAGSVKVGGASMRFPLW